VPERVAADLRSGPRPQALRVSDEAHDPRVALARAVGNRAFGRLLARRALTGAELSAPLVSWRLSGYDDLTKAYHNEKYLMVGSSGDGVAAFQQALLDAGYVMPHTFKRGIPSGKYDADTRAAIVRFQKDRKIGTDGVAGHDTLGELDAIAAAPLAAPPEVDLTDAAIGAVVEKGMQAANGVGSPTSGIWYDYNYFDAHQKEPGKYPWSDDWRAGHADEDYFQRLGWMDWRLKPGKSASKGIKAWLSGLTIAECLTTIIAVECDAMRAAVGNTAFDARFGSETMKVPDGERLRIHTSRQGTPLEGKITFDDPLNAGSFGARNLIEGQWVYLYNHPKYLLKHPGGAWQGENAVYMGKNVAGKQIFEGLGASATEDAMLDEMVGAYNNPRDGADYVALLERFVPSAPEVRKPNRQYLDRDTAYTKSLYDKYSDKIPTKYREDGGEFKDQITKDDIKNDQPYEIDGETRTGGFEIHSSKKLDTAIVGQIRPVP
jgi:peptidoglycan hydrolase-like protein with peptidoglycan-binding domain